MKPKVVFLARVKDAAGRDTWPVVQIKRGRPVPVPGAIYYAIRYPNNGRRILRSVGPNLEKAFIAYQNQEEDFTRARNGLKPLNPAAELLEQFAGNDPNGTRLRIADAITKFKTELHTLERSSSTQTAYGLAVDNFVKSCTKVYLDEINRDDIVAYVAWLKENLEIRKGNGGQQNTTLRNYLRNLTTFFLRFGIKNPLPAKDWPKVSKKNAKKYSLEVINQLLGAANEDEKDYILFLLYTGFRDGEVAHCEYRDPDWKNGTINVHDKPKYGWTVKDREQRPIDIPLPSDFIARLRARRERNKGCDLIFPNTLNRPDDHLILRLQRVAKRAGIELPPHAQHQFRKTFGSWHARKFGVETARQLLGHSNIATTARYLAGEEMNTPEAKRQVEDLFAGVGD